jgi:hypothetical protein
MPVNPREASAARCSAWDSGCIYITSGSSSEKAGYGAGESVAQALGNCRGEGLVCKPPVGGCIE